MHLISSLCVALTLASTCSAQAEPAKGKPAQRNVAILIYPGVELLDFAGPGEVFAGTHADKSGAGFEVYTVAETRDPLSSMGFVRITPQFSIADCPKPDVVVIPGGNVPSDNAVLIDWVKARAQDTEVVMSVCNGALLLGKAGLLAGLEVTTHKSALQHLAMLEPTAKVFTNRRYVDNGRIVTAAGISAGIDGALHLVARLQSDDSAWATARYMEYDWRPDEIAKLHAQPGREVEKSPASTLAHAFRGLAADVALAKYKSLEQPPTEAELNKLGYAMLSAGQREEALTLLTLATLAFPGSANARDSLSEAYELSGNVEQSKRLALEALALLDKEQDRSDKSRQAVRNAASSRLARFGGKLPADFPFRCGPCGGRCDKLGFLEDGACPVCGMALEARTKSE